MLLISELLANRKSEKQNGTPAYAEAPLFKNEKARKEIFNYYGTVTQK